MAQVEPSTHEVHVYAGWLFGDDFVGGFRYAYDFTSAWGAETSLGYSPNQANLDRPINGTQSGQAVTIDDDSGMTANVGGGIGWRF